MTLELNFHKGTITIDGDFKVPNSVWDDRSGRYRSEALNYRDIIEYLERSGIDFSDNVLDLLNDSSSFEGMNCVELRDYQINALNSWKNDREGVVVLPTGSGKTYVALKAIQDLKCSTFVAVPTLDLVDQWKEEILSKIPNADIGIYTGNKKELGTITVSTYDSAYIFAENIGNRFEFIIFDEVHHLPSEGYKQIAESFASPYRMGLTATYERQDNLHKKLPRLLGGKVYEMSTDELSSDYLAEFDIERIRVDLTPEEKEKYLKYDEKFKNYLKRSSISMSGPSDYKKIVMRSGNDPKAWKAIKSKEKARKIAYNSKNKIKELNNILRNNKDERIIIFTRYNDLVYKISERFFIPALTHKTSKNERQDILRKFKNSVYNTIVSSKVLDEGINVPDANIGIIMSGTGSSREFIQRLGRILRPKDKKAILYELITNETTEENTSKRRRQNSN